MVEQTAFALAEASSFSIIALVKEKSLGLYLFYFLLKINRSFFWGAWLSRLRSNLILNLYMKSSIPAQHAKLATPSKVTFFPREKIKF